MINAERIAEMKRLSAGASGYRWLVEGGKFGEHTIAAQAHYADDLQISDAVTDEVHTLVDAQFIAESRQFVPDIIAAYEEQAKLIRALTINLECIRATCIAAKDNYIEESDIDDILELVDEVLK